MKINLNIDDLFDTYNKFCKLVNEKENNFDIYLDNIENLTKSNLNQYKAFLDLVSDVIINEHKKGNIISINVLTDIFTRDHSILPDDSGLFLICNNCPCYHCTPNENLFKEFTGIKYLPIWQYCNKAFIEMEISRKLIEKLQLNIEISDIDYKDLMWITNKLYGNSLTQNLNEKASY